MVWDGFSIRFLDQGKCRFARLRCQLICDTTAAAADDEPFLVQEKPEQGEDEEKEREVYRFQEENLARQPTTTETGNYRENL